MSAPKLTVPNVNHITRTDPKLGEALTAVQNFVNKNVTPVSGNKQAAPTFVNPSKT